MYPSKVRIPLFTANNLNMLDPAHITNSTESNLIRSIYSTLVYFDTNGRIRPGGASTFDILDNKIRFHMRASMQTVDGHPITAEDAYLSIKRQLILDKNTHGKLTDFLDCFPIPKKITDTCSGLKLENNIVVVTLKSAKYIPFFLPMLANPDFAIIPKKSVDYTDPEMKITNLRNTSGAYYIEKHDEKHAYFKVNSTNYLIDERNPKEIEVTFNAGDLRDTDFINNKYEVIPTFGIVTKKNLEFIGNTSNYNVHKTLPIQLTYIDFKKTGLNVLSREERIAAGITLRKAYLEKFRDHFNLSEANQYFVVAGEGELQQTEIIKINESFGNVKPLDRTVTVDIANMWPEKAKPIISAIPNFQFKELATFTDAQTEKSPQLYIISSDTGGFDNISLLSYLQSLNHFGMSNTEFEKWLDDYINSNDEATRLKKFRDLHFNMLYNAQVIPIGTEPYYGIAHKPWKIEAYEMFAGSPFWTIKREQ